MSAIGELFSSFGWGRGRVTYSSSEAAGPSHGTTESEKKEKAEDVSSKEALEMKSNSDKASYVMGFVSALQLKAQLSGLNIELLKKGFSDSISDREPALPKKELEEIAKSVLNHVQVHQRKSIEPIIEKNKEEEEEFFEANKSKAGLKTLQSGLQYEILQSGSGIIPLPTDSVTAHYRGTLLNGTVFADTYQRKQPITFKLDNCLAGWSEALKRMKVGDKWKLFIPAQLAFGDNGEPRFKIEPGSAIIVEMELISVNK